MAPGKISYPSYPSVFVVDGNMRPPPPLPPKPARYLQRREVVQKLLVILVAVALCGMALEACFIYNLYSVRGAQTPPDEPQTGMRKQDKDAVSPKQKLFGEMKPSKPMAHLTTGKEPTTREDPKKSRVVLWPENSSVLHHVKYHANEGKLIIEKEGYYSVYSKINYKEDNNLFTHSVIRNTKRYAGDDRALLQSSWYHPYHKQKTNSTENSYLSGIYHLYKDDAVYVTVKNGIIVYSNDAENFFGVYMV